MVSGIPVFVERPSREAGFFEAAEGGSSHRLRAAESFCVHSKVSACISPVVASDAFWKLITFGQQPLSAAIDLLPTKRTVA
jgi:hypothetical protein